VSINNFILYFKIYIFKCNLLIIRCTYIIYIYTVRNRVCVCTEIGYDKTENVYVIRGAEHIYLIRNQVQPYSLVIVVSIHSQ